MTGGDVTGFGRGVSVVFWCLGRVLGFGWILHNAHSATPARRVRHHRSGRGGSNCAGTPNGRLGSTTVHPYLVGNRQQWVDSRPSPIPRRTARSRRYQPLACHGANESNRPKAAASRCAVVRAFGSCPLVVIAVERRIACSRCGIVHLTRQPSRGEEYHASQHRTARIDSRTR